MRAFREVFEPAGRNAAVVGAGGGARAIAWGLKHAGRTVSVFNRNEAAGRASPLADGRRIRPARQRPWRRCRKRRSRSI
ncbi:MAG: hypothetical protein IPK66_19090 [Rhodospirillales bacterium]|nr:hypothetical protein [Rhodospirillales bacterium]